MMNAIKLPLTAAAFMLAPLLSSFGQTSIFVDGGSFSAPFYRFYADSGLTTELNIQAGGTDALNINETYVFSGGSGTHPFYLSDQGYEAAPLSITLTGDGAPASGITSETQSFQLSFDSFDPGTDTLTYFCTNHNTMVSDFNVVPEPATFGLFAGGLALLLMILRRQSGRAR